MRAILTNERGSVMSVVVLGTLVICGMAGLAIDGARGYVTWADAGRKCRRVVGRSRVEARRE
jgi:hypothetical protein